MVKVALHPETFNDPAHPGWDSWAWNFGNTWARFSGGKLLIDSANTGSYPLVYSTVSDDLSGSAFSWWMQSGPSGTNNGGYGSNGTFGGVYLFSGDTNNCCEWTIDGKAWGYKVRNAGVESWTAFANWDGVDTTQIPRWFRIANVGGGPGAWIMQYEYSWDGLSWLIAGRKTATWDITACRMYFACGHWQDETIFTASFDHANFTPTVAPANSPWRMWDGYREIPMLLEGWYDTPQPDPLPTLLSDVAGIPGLDDTVNDGGHQPLPAIGALVGRTFYVVYDVPDLSSNFGVLANVYQESGGATANGRIGFQLDATATGNTRAVYTLPGGSSSFTTLSGYRTVGRHVAAYVLADGLASATVDQDGAIAVIPFTPGTGFALTSPSARSYRTSGVQRLLVYPTAHDDVTRRQVMGWLAREHGVTLPTNYRTKQVGVARNLFPNPGAVSAALLSGWVGGSPNAGSYSSPSVGWSRSRSAMRITWSARSNASGDIGVSLTNAFTQNPALMAKLRGRRVTVAFDMVVSASFTSSGVIFGGILGTVDQVAQVGAVPVTAGVPARFWGTIDVGTDATEIGSIRANLSQMPLTAGVYAEVSNVDVYLGEYQPDRTARDGWTQNWSWDGQPWVSTSSGPASVAGTVKPLIIERVSSSGPQVVSKSRVVSAGGASPSFLMAARMPDTVRYGDRLLACVISGYNTSSFISLPSGYTELARIQGNGTTAVIGEKMADGTEARTVLTLGNPPAGVTTPTQIIAMTGIGDGIVGAPVTAASNGTVRYLPTTGFTTAPADGYALAVLGLNGSQARTMLLYASAGWTELGRYDNDVTVMVVLGRRVTAGEQIQIGWGQDPNASATPTANYAGAMVFLPAA